MATLKPFLRRKEDALSFDPFIQLFFGNEDLKEFLREENLNDFSYDSENEEYIGYFEMPGLNKDDIDIKIDGNKLLIKGQISDEKKQKKIGKREVYYEKDFKDKLKGDSVSAKLEDGILELSFKFKGESSMKSIHIQ